MTPKTIYRDESRIEGEMNIANSVVNNNLKDLAEKLRSDGIQFDNQNEFLEFVNDSNLADVRHKSIIETKLEKCVDEELKKMKIKSESVLRSLKDNAMQYDRGQYAKIRNDLVYSFQIYELKPTDFTFADGVPGVSISFKERLEETYSSILENDEQFAFWEEVRALCESFNKIEDLRQQMNQDSFILKYFKNTDYLYIKIERLPTNGRLEYFKAIPKPEGFVRERTMVI